MILRCDDYNPGAVHVEAVFTSESHANAELAALDSAELLRVRSKERDVRDALWIEEAVTKPAELDAVDPSASDPGTPTTREAKS